MGQKNAGLARAKARPGQARNQPQSSQTTALNFNGVVWEATMHGQTTRSTPICNHSRSKCEIFMLLILQAMTFHKLSSYIPSGKSIM